MHQSRRIFLLFSLLSVILIFFTLISIAVNPEDAHPFTEQKTFYLNFDNKTFEYEQRQLNESEYPFSHTYTFFNASNQTFWIELPKNSTISSSTLSLTGLILVNKTTLGDEIRCVEIGDLTGNGINEIVIGSYTTEGNTTRVYNSEKEFLWGYKPGDVTNDLKIANLTGSEKRLIVGSEEGVYILDSNGNEIDNNSIGLVRSLDVGNFTEDDGNEIVAGGDNLYLLNSSLDIIKNSTTITSVYSVAVGDVTQAYSGNEIVVGTGGTENNKIYLLNYTNDFNVIWSFSVEDIVYGVAIGNLSSDEGLEIVAVSKDKKVYVINSSGHSLWNYTLNDEGWSVDIGEFADTSEGNEIAVGSGGSVDRRIYVLNSTGGLILSYATEGQVRGIRIGNVTPDTGNNINEILGGTTKTGTPGYLYELNYDNYPTDLNFSVNSTLIWSKPGKFRETQVIDFDNFTDAIQSYLNNCTTKICVVPFIVETSHKGRLEVSGINITYTYDASTDIHNRTTDAWAKTQGIRVNQTVVSKAIEINYTEPALNISIKYMRIHDGATSCGLKNEEYEVVTINGDAYCNVTEKNIIIVPGESPYETHYLWDSLMEKRIPIFLNESQPYNTTGVDNYLWMKNITIWSNATEENFTQVIANTSINDSIVKGDVFLNVTWNGTVYNITPTTQCPTMGGVGNGFFACYIDTNGNGIPDFFNWTQPEASSTHPSVFYQAGGTRNLAPNITFANVTPESGLWGRKFNFTVTAEDDENDEINITLWVLTNVTSTWVKKDTKTISGSGTVVFEVTSDHLWVGINRYKFEYFDFNSTDPSQIFHSPKNSSVYVGPEVMTHNVTLEHIQGNGTNVSREHGITTTTLEVYFNDSTGFENWTEKKCIFWISLNDTTEFGYQENVNGSGYCTHVFDPNESYSVGPHTWWVTLNESFYNITNPQNFTVRVRGNVNVTISKPTPYQKHIRNHTLYLEAYLSDEYGKVIDDSTINTSAYTCTWFFNNTEIGTTQVNTGGYCSNTWIPNCTYQILDFYLVNVTLNGDEDENYSIFSNTSHVNIELIDEPKIFITSPESNKAFYKGTNLTLSAVVNDTCDTCNLNSYQVMWYVNLPYVIVNLNETSGIERRNEPVYITGEMLSKAGINLTYWRANNTKVVCNGTRIPSQVISSGEYLDSSSTITFLVNVSSNQNTTCYIFHNETNALENTSVAFIENGGFESGNLKAWNYTTCHRPYCLCNVSSTGEEEDGNYSLMLSADNGESSVNQTLHFPLNTNYIKIRFKAWGEFDTGAYFKLDIGTETCDLTPDKNTTEAQWNVTVCNGTFEGAKSIKISVNDAGDGGNERDASHVIIDYICPANSSGECVTFDTGAPLETLTGRENITPLLYNSTDLWWEIPVNFKVGSYTIFANFTGEHYISKENKTYIDVFGIANVSYFNFTPMVEGECEGNLCFTGVDLKLICRVSDKNTSKGIRNFTVYFYNESTYIGSAQTNGTGYAVFIWVNSTNSPGEKEIKCNISDSPDLYYNVTENEMSFNITFSSSTTNGTLNVTPLYGVATNITKSGAALLPFNVTVNNTGEGNMFGISVKVNNITGITGVANVCSYLANGTSCNGTITLNVSREAMLGNNSVNITLEWSNPDPNGPGFQNKTIVVNVTNTTSVNIVNDTVNFSIPYGGKEENIFIVEDFGNAGLENVNFTLWGGNSTVIYDWIRLNGTEINQTNFSIERLQESTVNISIEVPENQTYMGKVFWAYLTASVDNSFCDNSYEKCNDTVLINITVTQQDWTVEPREDSIRVAGIISNTLGEFNLINVTNLKNFTATINVTTKVVNSSGDERGSEFFKIYLIENGTVSPLPQQVTIQPLSSVYINITYNTSNASENDVDVYTLNISMQNQNSSATPIWINISRVLRVSNFAINIISPTSANPVGPVNVGEIIEIHANATIGKNEHLTENVTWSVWIGGVACPVKSATNVTGKEYDWVINCSAPQIPGNPINNTLLVSGYYTTQNIDFNDTELGAIIYNDTTAPKIWSIEIIPEGHSSATEIDGDPNVHYSLESGNLTIKVNITENNVTSAAWIRVLDPNGGTQEGNLTKIGNYWVYNYTNPGIIGDYEVIVYAKDPVGNLNTTENLPIRFFDVYKPMKFYSNFTYPNGTSINVTLKFYKHGTNWKLHENSSSYFNLTVHERKYDIKAELLGHTVVFLNADLNASARSQFGENGENVTNPFRFDYFPDYTYPQINIMPSNFKNPILGLVVEAPNLTFDSANITINYTEALQAALNIGKSINSQNLEVLVCTDWNYTARRCDGTITNSSYIDVTPSNGLITFSTIPQSAYIVAEGCYNAEGELIDCSGYEKTATTVAGGGGGGSTEKSKWGEATSFTVETNLDATFGDIIVTQGETKEYWLFIRNHLDTYLTPKITLTGEIKNFLTISDANPVIPPKESKRVSAIVSIPPNTKIGTYRGTITIEAGNEKTEIPVSIKVVAKGETLLSLEVDIIKKRIEINEPLKFQVKLRNLGTKKELKPTLTYLIRDGKTDKIVKEVKENVTLERLLAFTRKIDLNGTGLDEGEHVLEVWAEINGNAVSDMESFELVKPFLATTLGVILLYTLLVLSIIVATIFIRKYYVSWKMEKEAKKRYIFPVRLNAIPQKTENSFWIGTLAGSKIKAWLNPDDLTTHVLIAGATGAGKSVGASVIVEEALEKNIPVIVFDPTAQWTGFVRACSDKNLLKYYPKFGMSPKDARAYKGMIFEMTDPNQKIDFKELMKPGEITIFTLHKLKPEEFDQAVRNIIDTMFKVGWEESTKLKMLVVFDEVHRLLEKYGGKGGYVALERACREFRKWGIGIIMCSQVLADFKEAVAGNVLTDIQLNTKNLEDIRKAKDKYGEEYANRITRQGLGVGMIHNPKYNDGKPYFIQFRPTYHNPHKITNEELEEYKEFAKEISQLKDKINKLREEGKDVFDLELELKLAEDKLKLGNFRMAKIYIDSIKKNIGV